MTEAEWHDLPGALMIYHAEQLVPVSPRKLRLLAVAYARYLEGQPECAEAKHVSHLGEDVAESRATLDEMVNETSGRMWSYPGTWRIARVVLSPDEMLSNELRRQIGLAFPEPYDPAVAVRLASQQTLAVRPYIRCILGNPFRSVAVDQSWLTSTVVALARGIYDDRAFDRLPILADALQDAGCDSDSVLSHCRDAGPHARGCWVVDLLLGKA